MRFYTKAHTYYCGIDLHARWMYLCILDQQGEVLLHRNLRACPEAFLKAIEPFRQDLVVAVECLFTWYWLADLCAQPDSSRLIGHRLPLRPKRRYLTSLPRVSAPCPSLEITGQLTPVEPHF
jgi:hypothetical protein